MVEVSWCFLREGLRYLLELFFFFSSGAFKKRA